MTRIDPDPIDRDERLGEAIEAYLALAEEGPPPDPDEFAAQYPELSDDLREALDGLALVHGLVGGPAGPGRSLEAGRRVGGYRIVRELGRGGMGVVYEAVHVDLDRPVALKVLGTHAAPDSNGRRRFLNEAKTAAALHHTHIVPVFDVGQVGGLCYYAMQRIEGCGLDRVLKSMRRDRSLAAGSGSHRPARTGSRGPGGADSPPPNGADDDLALSISGLSGTASWHGGTGVARSPLRAVEDGMPPFEPPRGSAYYRWVAQVGRQAADALAYAHRRGVIHRDVKPSNLLVESRGSVWVADFGLARRLADPGLTQTDSLLGTPRYMSPEQAKAGPIDGRTDVYSLGATLYELLTLRPPFEGKTAAELVQQILHKEPPSPRKADPRIPRDLETIVLKAMAKRPSDRYETATELADDLGRFLDFEPVQARRIGPAGRAWRFARRHPSLTAVSTCSLAVILAVATWAHLNVLHQRNQAQRASVQKDEALIAAKEAIRQSEADRIETRFHMAEAIQLSTLPDRRKRGLERIKEAISLKPEPQMRLRLRDEAVKFLAVRDVEPRAVLQTGWPGGVTFDPESGRIVSLSEDGTTLTLSDPAGSEPKRQIVVQSGPSSHRRPGGPGMGRWPTPNRLASVGKMMASVKPDGEGVGLIMTSTGAHFADLGVDDHQIDSIFGSPGGDRLVIVEQVVDRHGNRPFWYRAALWDPSRQGGGLIAVLAEPEDRPGTFQKSLAGFSPDGQAIATTMMVFGGPPVEDSEQGSTITIWDAETGAVRRKIDVPGIAVAIALGPDDLVAAAVSDGTIRLWDGETGKALPGLYHQNVRTLKFSPDGTLLAVAGNGPGIELLDPATNMTVATVRTPKRPLDLVFSSDGRTLASACEDGVYLWGIVDPVGRVRLSSFAQPATSLAFGPAGVLAMASRDRTLRLWHPDQCPTSARGLGDIEGNSAVFDDQGRLIVADINSLARIRAADGQILDQIGLRPDPIDLPVLTGMAVLSQPVEALRRAATGIGPPAPSFMARSDGGRLIYLAQGPDVFAWSSDEPAEIRRIAPPPNHGRRGGRGEARQGEARQNQKPSSWGSLVASPDGRRLYLTTMGDGNVLKVWDVDEGMRHVAAPWSGRYHDVHASALSLDGRVLAIGSRAGAVQLIDAIQGTIAATLTPEGDEDGWITSLAFAPDGRTLAVGLSHGQVSLWSLATPHSPRPILNLPGHTTHVRNLTFDEQGLHLASAADKVVQVWDLGRVRTRLEAMGLGW